MKAYYDLGFPSRGIERVIKEIDRYCPESVEKVSFPGEADFIILHVVGRHDHIQREVEHTLEHGRHFAVIQYALQSTRNPDPKDWQAIWNEADIVWSYYDLSQYCKNFYHAPLAANPEVFYPQPISSWKYMVGTTGDTYKIECLGEIRLAAWNAQGKVAHIGHRLDQDPNVDYHEDITDEELCTVYNSSKWWSALRRKDGFELGAVEALMCGTRPIMFDTPNYHQWFDGLVEYVPECEPGKLAGRLKQLFLGGMHNVSLEEIEETRTRFNWKVIIDGFWNCILHQ